MSAYTATHAESEWHSQRTKPGDANDGTMGLHYSEVSGLSLDTPKRPPLRTHKSFPYMLSQPHHSATQQSAASDHPIASPQPQRERITISNLEESPQRSLPNVTYGGSAPASPVSRLTPPSPEGEKDQREGDNDAALSASADEGDDSKPMTAAELRAQKRKMKRFRLTHNQTRFLMSEFARQAHPDAAHRERLAREIPGLSPRQVQVWFQNRRAKLKRLTSDDRERMMRSRALPDDFDMTQALHSPFGTAGHGVGTPMASPATNFSPSFPEGNMVRPLSLDSIRRYPEGPQMSPAGVPPPFGGYSFTPPQSATDTSSPVSATGEPNPFAYSQSMEGSPRRPNPFVGAVPSPAPFPQYSQVPRLQLHDRVARARAESLCSPLRTSMSYSNDGTLSQSNIQPSQSVENTSMGEQRMPNLPSTSLPGSSVPYGLGYSYSHIPGFQSGAQQRMRSFSSSVPRRIELSQHSAHYQASRTPGSSNPQSATFPNYQGSPLSTPGAYNQSPLMSAPHNVTTFSHSPSYNGPYGQAQGGQSDQYQPAPVFSEVEGSNQQTESSGSGVQLPPQY
ncbi:Homeobox [Lasiodiplodia theobromae]|nr:Homeobox [Lasiodiplodia theobromae]